VRSSQDYFVIDTLRQSEKLRVEYISCTQAVIISCVFDLTLERDVAIYFDMSTERVR